MKKIIMLSLWGILTSFTAFNAYALSLNAEDYLSIGEQSTLYGRGELIIRSAPNSMAEKVGTFQSGDYFKVLEFTDKEMLHGLDLNWLKISFWNDSDEMEEGYIWSGELIRTILPLDNETSLVRGWATRLPGDNFIDKLFIIRNGVQIHSLLAMDLSGGNSNLGITLDVRDDAIQLDGVDQVIKISSSGEACAIPSYDHYFGWNRTSGKLMYIISTINAGDVSFLHSERIYFPHNGAPGNVIIKIAHNWDGDLTANEPTTFSDEYAAEIYLWNGKSLSPINATNAADVSIIQNEYVYYPDNNTHNNILIKVVHSSSSALITEESTPSNSEYFTELYRWDEGSLIQIQQEPFVLESYR